MSEAQKTPALPNPGSDTARAQGCTCHVIDNGHGNGLFGDGEKYGWFIREDCPMHGTKDSGHERT